MNIWYYTKDRQRFGPCDRGEIEKLYLSGSLGPKDLVWEQGTPDWVEAAAVFAPVPPLPPPPRPAPSNETRTCGFAMASLCLSLLGGFSCCCGGPVLVILAVIFGHISLYRIDSDPGLKGRELALAGLVIGYLVLAFTLLGCIGLSASKFYPKMGLHHIL